MADFTIYCDDLQEGIWFQELDPHFENAELENCASHSRYFSDELDAQNFYQKGNKCLSYSYAYGILFL